MQWYFDIVTSQNLGLGSLIIQSWPARQRTWSAGSSTAPGCHPPLSKHQVLLAAFSIHSLLSSSAVWSNLSQCSTKNLYFSSTPCPACRVANHLLGQGPKFPLITFNQEALQGSKILYRCMLNIPRASSSCCETNKCVETKNRRLFRLARVTRLFQEAKEICRQKIQKRWLLLSVNRRSLCYVFRASCDNWLSLLQLSKNRRLDDREDGCLCWCFGKQIVSSISTINLHHVWSL